MNASRRVLAVILIAIFSVYLLRVLIHGADEIIEVNDFEVFYHVGSVAAEHQPSIYDVVTPVKQRGPFLYPPSAAVLFVPLSWLTHDASGVVFSILKFACLSLLYWGSVRFSGAPPRDWPALLILMLIPAILVHRAVDSDVGNGQVNIIVAAAAVGGVWLMMLSRHFWWLGAILLAWAVAVKLTPALLLAVPLLNKKWKACTAATLITVLLLAALPALWFGSNHFAGLMAKHREITGRFTMDSPALARQVSINEMIQFTRVQLRGDLDRDGAFDDPDQSPVITGQSGANLLNPELRSTATRTWLATGIGIGALFLIGRYLLFIGRGERADWTWDLAMMCVLTVLLSPRVHKAHLVILIVPAGWIAARMFVLLRGDRALSPRLPVAWLGSALGLMILTFLVMENLPVPIPGVTNPSFHCLPFIGLILMIGLLARLASVGPADSAAPAPASSSQFRP